MKAAVLRNIGERFEIEEVAMPKIGPDEVLIETRTCGICRTDLHIQDGLAYIPDFPHVAGHEPAGVVAAVGENVANITPGQRVVPHLFLICGECRYCRSGMEAQCANVRGVIGVTAPGGFAQYFKAPARNLLKLPDEVPFDAGGLVSCAIITATRAFRRARLQLGDTALVIGAGGIGRMLVQLLHASGIQIAVLSRSAGALAACQRDGASLAISPADDAPDRIREWSAGEGVTCVFDCVGTGQTMRSAAASVRRAGRIVVIGEEPEYPEVDTIQIAQKELEIIGSRNGSLQDGVEALRLLQKGTIKPPIHSRYPLEGLNDALSQMRQGKAEGRIIIEI